MFGNRFTSLFGIFILLLISWLLSNKKMKINFKTVICGLLLQFLFAFMILKTYPGKRIFEFLNIAVVKLLSFTDAGATFLFGDLITKRDTFGYIFAFQVLPTIIFFSSLIGILYYLGVMQFIVEIYARIMTRFMGTSGAESLCASANVFVGQTEAPVVIRPYINEMTNSELMAVMTAGFATIAGGVMAAYVGLLKEHIPDIAGHLLSASVMSAPAALVIAKVVYPETEVPKTAGVVKIVYEKTDANIVDAATNGATLGLRLAFNVGAMLLAFLSLIAMLNFFLNGIGNFFGFKELSLQKLFSWIFLPFALVLGIPLNECGLAATLLGEKVALNEFVAYLHFSNELKIHSEISHRTRIIMSYALCGFANFGSVAIQIGGISAIAPERRQDLARIGLKAMLAGALASWMTACIAGFLVG